ncbi:MAG: glycosyltransferase family 39 protein [Acidimicrobiales bacterium]
MPLAREATLTVRADVALTEPVPVAGTRRRWRVRQVWRFWRSPAGQPPWARPALLIVTALAGLAYAWRFDQAYLEPFYGGAARSMSLSLHNFFYGAADPWATISVDKIPGALWFQAISLRIFGFHVWALVLPQVIEGMLTVLVLYRAVRRVAGAGAGLVAAVILAGSPIVILLDRGNISDSLLILLLVLAADATVRACQRGRLRSLLWAGALVGFAFQTKMLQAWIVLPALFVAYLVAAPVASFWRRAWHLAASTAVVGIVSLSWMSVVSVVPQSSRPYADGSCDDSVFNQVFSYNGFSRLGAGLANTAGCHRRSAYLRTLLRYSGRESIGTGFIGPSWDRLLQGPFGHDAAWLLLPAVVAAVWLFVLARGAPRTDLRRAAVILWTVWLVITFGFFSGGQFLNSYYLAALIPPVAALCGMGALAAWERRSLPSVRVGLAVLTVATLAVTIALVPGYVGVRPWIVGSAVVVGLLALVVLVGSLRKGHDSVWALGVGPALAALAMLLGSFWASAVVVQARLSPFDSPYAPASVNAYTQKAAANFPLFARGLRDFADTVPARTAVDVFETSQTTGYYILATGREFLPIGGFSGAVPSPTLPAFKRLVAEGRVQRVTVVTKPLTNEPVLRWVVAHCTRLGPAGYDAAAQATSTAFSCMRPQRASRPAPVSSRRPPAGSPGTASPA